MLVAVVLVAVLLADVCEVLDKAMLVIVVVIVVPVVSVVLALEVTSVMKLVLEDLKHPSRNHTNIVVPFKSTQDTLQIVRSVAFRPIIVITLLLIMIGYLPLSSKEARPPSAYTSSPVLLDQYPSSSLVSPDVLLLTRRRSCRVMTMPPEVMLPEETVPPDDSDIDGIESAMSTSTSLGDTIVHSMTAVPGLATVSSGSITSGGMVITRHERLRVSNRTSGLTSELDGYWSSSTGELVYAEGGLASFDDKGRYPIIMSSSVITMMGLNATDLTICNVSWVDLNGTTMFVWFRLGCLRSSSTSFITEVTSSASTTETTGTTMTTTMTSMALSSTSQTSASSTATSTTATSMSETETHTSITGTQTITSSGTSMSVTASSVSSITTTHTSVTGTSATVITSSVSSITPTSTYTEILDWVVRVAV
jgi:hypothetical protein